MCSEDYTVKKVVRIVLISLVKHIFKIAYLMISVASIRLKNLMTVLNCKKKKKENNYSMLTIFSNWLPVIDSEFLQWSLKLGISAVQDWKKKIGIYSKPSKYTGPVLPNTNAITVMKSFPVHITGSSVFIYTSSFTSCMQSVKVRSEMSGACRHLSYSVFIRFLSQCKASHMKVQKERKKWIKCVSIKWLAWIKKFWHWMTI